MSKVEAFELLGMDSEGIEVALIAPGAPWQNGKNERFNGILSQELLSREVWGNLLEARVLCEKWRQRYNEIRPHGSLKMMTPSASTHELVVELEDISIDTVRAVLRQMLSAGCDA